MLLLVPHPDLLFRLLPVKVLPVLLELQPPLSLLGLRQQISRHLRLLLLFKLRVQVKPDSQLAEAWQVGLLLLEFALG